MNERNEKDLKRVLKMREFGNYRQGGEECSKMILKENVKICRSRGGARRQLRDSSGLCCHCRPCRSVNLLPVPPKVEEARPGSVDRRFATASRGQTSLLPSPQSAAPLPDSKSQSQSQF